MNVDSEESRQGVVGTWVFCLLYCGFSFGLFYFAVKEWREAVPILITGFFAAFGVVYIVLAIRHTLGQATFGDVKLLMERPPPSIGGVLKGSVTVPRAAMRAATLVAELTCYKQTFGGGKKGGSSDEPVWAAKRSFPIRSKAGGGSAAIAIEIPPELEPTKARPTTVTWSSGDPPKVFWNWMLRVTVDLPGGVDLDRSYTINVLPAQPGAAAAAAPAPAPAPKAAQMEMRAPLAARAVSAPVQKPIPIQEKKQIPDIEETPVPREESRTSLWVLLAANAVAVAGVLFWGWRVQDIVFLYWMENLVIGALNVPRILIAQPDQSANLAKGIEVTQAQLLGGKLFVAAFFLVHYGAFCFGHGEFLVHMFPGAERVNGIFAAIGVVLREPGMLWAVIAIAASHLVSFLVNYLGRREYEGADVGQLMFRPYKRIFVTHIFIIVGGLLLQAFKLPLAALVLFIGLKIGFDAYYHRSERRALAGET